MTFLQFIATNVRRKFRFYLAYFLSVTFVIMIYFTYGMFIYHPGTTTEGLHYLVVNGMTVAEAIIFCFSFAFIWYSTNIFLKMRKKEFAVLSILGISRWQINFMIFMENLLLVTLSMAVGIGFGLLFSKSFFIFASAILDMDEIPFYIPTKALLLTIVSFYTAFLLISFFTLFTTKHRSIKVLLDESRKPKKEPKGSVILALFSILCIGSAYYITFTLKNDIFEVIRWMFIVILLTCVGTYFFYSQFGAFLINWVKKRPILYWRGTRIIWLSDLAYRIKDNAQMFFMVTIVSTVAFTSAGALISVLGILGMVKDTLPLTIEYKYYHDEKLEGKKSTQIIEDHLANYHVNYERVEVEDLYFSKPVARADVIKISAYNQLAALLERETYQIKKGEALWIRASYLPEDGIPDLLAKDGKPFRLVKKIDKPVLSYQWNTLAVSDEDFAYLKEKASSNYTVVGYMVHEWRKGGSINKDAVAFSKEINQKLAEDQHPLVRDAYYAEAKRAVGSALFIGLFVAVIFYVCAGSFLYFRLYMDLDRDKQYYQTISKIGLSIEEWQKSMTVQIALLFFVPFTLAIVHTSVALVGLQKVYSSGTFVSIFKTSIVSILIFFVLQLVYFLIVRSHFLQKLKRHIM
ncbi:ABC transporter permease [Brevibacillus laterosporus]|uniref:ABC transporter permease n=1 Tax=Brevibacillus laterosporus TaxID=1465 RepID=UPI0003B2341E|nr:ABC transporter permease [Brevibacillus laterosporus]ERM18041.1 ABC transporter permease [Brevibacillus laterosporus PE36]